MGPESVGSDMSVKEAMKRLSRKMGDMYRSNQDYLKRQFDTAPAKFKGEAGFRRPAPSAHPLPNVPTLEGRSKFNIRYFDRDTRRAPDTALTLGTSVKLLEATEASLGETGVVATTVSSQHQLMSQVPAGGRM